MSEKFKKVVRDLRAAAYMLPSHGPWEEIDGAFLPSNICTMSADLMEWMNQHIDKLDAEIAELNSKAAEDRKGP